MNGVGRERGDAGVAHVWQKRGQSSRLESSVCPLVGNRRVKFSSVKGFDERGTFSLRRQFFYADNTDNKTGGKSRHWQGFSGIFR